MKIRKKIPSNNPYYIRQVSGGLNGAVAGSPTISGANVLCNCVGYANGRFNEIINDPELKGTRKAFRYQLVCNAENFIESAQRQGLKISPKPVVGGIMVWQKGSTLGGGDGAGHVAIVEQVYSDGSVYTSESGWGSRDWAFKNLRRNNSNGRWGQTSAYKFRGCIINPGSSGKVVPSPKLVVDGIGGVATVMRLQEYFKVSVVDGIISGQNKTLHKYYPSFQSVSFGGGGSATIKALQKWVGVTADGIIGLNTVKALQKKLKELGYSVGTVDGIFGTKSMKALQEGLNNDFKKKSSPSPDPTPTKDIKVVDVSEFQNTINNTVQKRVNEILEPTPKKKVYIGQACYDYDGKAGDSSGKEVCKSAFKYSASSTSCYNWTYVFRPKDEKKAEKAAAMCEKGIANNAIGYCKNGETAYGKDKAMTKLAKAVNYDLSKITTKCGCSCGDFVCLCNHYAGLSTCYIGSGLGLSNNLKKNSNFECITYKKGMTLKRGDTIITAHANGKDNHVAMVL